MISLILLVFAFVLFIVAGVYSAPEPPWRSRLVCFGLGCWVLAEILKGGAPLLR